MRTSNRSPAGGDFARAAGARCVRQVPQPVALESTDGKTNRRRVHPDNPSDRWRDVALVRQQDDVKPRALGRLGSPSIVSLQRRHLTGRETHPQRRPHGARSQVEASV